MITTATACWPASEFLGAGSEALRLTRCRRESARAGLKNDETFAGEDQI